MSAESADAKPVGPHGASPPLAPPPTVNPPIASPPKAIAPTAGNQIASAHVASAPIASTTAVSNPAPSAQTETAQTAGPQTAGPQTAGAQTAGVHTAAAFTVSAPAPSAEASSAAPAATAAPRGGEIVLKLARALGGGVGYGCLAVFLALVSVQVYRWFRDGEWTHFGISEALRAALVRCCVNGGDTGRLAGLVHWIDAPVDWLGLHQAMEIAPASLGLFALSILGNSIFIYCSDRLDERRRAAAARVADERPAGDGTR